MLRRKREFGQLANVAAVLQRRPDAAARIEGSCIYPDIEGCVWFFCTGCGVLAAAEIYGLPEECGGCSEPFFGFHIHEGGCCSGTEGEPFADAGGHYNPDCCQHPHHAGDMPPLLGNKGYALQIFLTGRISIDDIVGRTVIIHRNPDDFTTQPSGNSGAMIACGEIKRFFC